MGDDLLEYLCALMHDAYEIAAVRAGWETQARSRKPWAEVPEPNKVTMRAAVQALLEEMPALGFATTRELLEEISARIEVDHANGGGGLDYTTVGER